MGNKVISVIVPCYNGERHLRECLDSILKLKIPDFYTKEVIVVDNNSSDSSASIIKDEYGGFVTYVHETQQGRSQARNRGIAQSSGEILCFCDVDVCLTPDWFMLSWNKAKEFDDWALISTHVVLRPADSSWFEKFRVHQERESYNAILVINEFSPCLNTAAFITKKNVLNEVGNFDDSLDYFEDIDLGRCIGLLGRPIIASASIAYCYSGMSFWSYMLRSYKIGAMSVRYWYKWSSRSLFKTKLWAIKFYFLFSLYNYSLRYRADYMLYKTFVNLLAVLGAMTMLFKKVDIKKFPLESGRSIRIFSDNKIIRIDLKSGDLKILKFSNSKQVLS